MGYGIIYLRGDLMSWKKYRNAKVYLMVTIIIVSSVLTGIIFAASNIPISELPKVWFFNTLYVTFYFFLFLLLNTYLIRKDNKDK